MKSTPDVDGRRTLSLDELASTVGGPGSRSAWLHIDQAMIDEFAAVTGDDAFIHTDPLRAAGTRFRGTIAHGLLTLSLLPKLMRSATPILEGTRMGVNYGFNRVRFIDPVPVNSRICATLTLEKLKEKSQRFFLLTYGVTIEIENHPKPAAKAIWLLGRWV